MSSRFTLLGISDDVTECDCCGKVDLKCTMALAEHDEDGNAIGEVYYGRDCGARALGWKVSADRAEKLVRGTARILWDALDRIWRSQDGGCNYGGPVRGTVDGAAVEVWCKHYLGRIPEGWTACDKSGIYGWRAVM